MSLDWADRTEVIGQDAVWNPTLLTGAAKSCLSANSKLLNGWSNKETKKTKY